MYFFKYCSAALVLCLVSLSLSASTVDEYDLEVLEETMAEPIDPFSISSTLITSSTVSEDEKILTYNSLDNEPETNGFDFTLHGKIFILYFNIWFCFN